MDRNILGTRKVTQIGFIVKDIEATARAYAEFFGVDVPPIRLTDTYDVTHAEYRGQPGKARAKLAFFDCDGVQIELIEPDREQSVWRDYLEAHGEGIQHIAFQIKGMQQKLEQLDRNGMKLVQRGEYTGGRYAYVDAKEPLKTDIELLEND